MNRIVYATLLAGLLAFTLAGCDTAGDEGGTVTLTGRVVDVEGAPVADALITVHANENTAFSEDITARTDAAGTYSIRVEIEANTELEVTASKHGQSASTFVSAFAGDTHEVELIELTFSSEEQQGSGAPSNLKLLSQSRQSISVKESGGSEVAQLTFQVADSSGRPVVLDEQALVSFRLSGASPPDAFISPSEARTNNNGEVTVNLSSGTTAGVVQIVAETQGAGDATIRSRPVGITIHGGLPVERNFSIRPGQINNPAGSSEAITISAIAGDQYNNPVKPNTAIYFTTDGNGIIDGSVGTDAQGQGSVSLFPTSTSSGSIVTVIAETANQEEQSIYATSGTFFSGVPEIEVSPATAQLDQTYMLEVTDQNGFPLAPGTTISVVAEGTQVQATGNTAVTLGDPGFAGSEISEESIRRGAGVTEFTFRTVADPDPENPLPAELETITVTVGGPNGSLEIVLTPPDGNSLMTTTDGATVELRGPGAVIRAPRR